MNYVSMFSQIVAAITIIWHIELALELFIPPYWQVSKIKRRIFYKDLEFSSVITTQQVLIKQQFQYNIHITAFCYF